MGQRSERSEAGARLGAGEAALAGFLLLGLVNQALIALLLPAVPGRVRALHHAYDLGHFALLAVLSFAAVELCEIGLRRAPARLLRFGRGLRVLLLGLAVFVVGMLTLADDLESFAYRKELDLQLVTCAASACFAIVLGSSAMLRRLPLVVRRLLLLPGLGAGVLNALVLDGDYLAIHLMLTWLGALLAGEALVGVALPSFVARARLGVVVALALGGVLALLVPPKSSVLQRLYALQSSALAPFAGRLVPEATGTALDRVPVEYVSSPWFRDRGAERPAPPSGAIELPEPRIVVFLTIDAFRADVLETKKYAQQLPELSQLRDTSAYFTVARAPTPATTTTMASIFSGRYYSQLGWSKEGEGNAAVIDDVPRFPELLSAAGVRTVHAATAGRIREQRGVALGFTIEHWIPKTRTRGADAMDKLLQEIDAGAGQRQFLYAHFMEPHAPYDLGGKRGTPFARYVREIAIVDRQIRRLRQHLAAKGLERHTALVISADHGEAFGEHGAHYHAKNVYEELLRVPLIVHVPGLAARRIDEPVSVMDVGPTVLDLFGLPTPPSFMAQSLAPLVAGKPVRLTRPIAADTGRRKQALYFRDGKKVIFDRKGHTIEVYDLATDPGELSNLVESRDPGISRAIETAKLFFEVHRRR